MLNLEPKDCQCSCGKLFWVVERLAMRDKERTDPVEQLVGSLLRRFQPRSTSWEQKPIPFLSPRNRDLRQACLPTGRRGLICNSPGGSEETKLSYASRHFQLRGSRPYSGSYMLIFSSHFLYVCIV